jgi:predicted ATPase
MAAMFVEHLSVERELIGDDERGQWPFTIPCVAAIARDGLDLRRPVTFLVGENGSGKSTLVEAIAEAAGLDARGGRAGRKYGNQREKTRLVALMHELGRSGAQVICATHSPVLASTPEADIIEVGDFGFRRTGWADLTLTDHWRRYLNDPASYLRHLIDP